MQAGRIASSPGPFPAFQCCTLKSGRRAWYAKSRDGENVQSISRVKGHHGSATTCKQQKTRLYRYLASSPGPSLRGRREGPGDEANRYHTSEMRSFEGSESTFSVDRRYGVGVSKRLGLFDLDCHLLSFVCVIRRPCQH